MTRNEEIMRFDQRLTSDPSYVLDNIKIGFRPKSTETPKEQLVKPFAGTKSIEQYLYVQEKESRLSAKMSKNHLKSLGITQKKAWETAKDNTRKDIEIEDVMGFVGNVLEETAGHAISEDEQPAVPLYVITNNAGYRGASAVLNEEAIKNFLEILNTDKVIVFPSSIHEQLLMPVYPDTGKEELEYYSKMVKEINATQLMPEDVLTDTMYFIKQIGDELIYTDDANKVFDFEKDQQEEDYDR